VLESRFQDLRVNEKGRSGWHSATAPISIAPVARPKATGDAPTVSDDQHYDQLDHQLETLSC
jgi:hypothetical protein